MGKEIIRGTIKRESQVLSGYVNERIFVLEENTENQGENQFTLSSYRDPSDQTPSKVWNISGNTTVSPVNSGTFKLKEKGQSSALGFLTALAKQKSFKSINLFAIKVVFGSDSLPWASDELTLCFEDQSIAEEWLTQLEKAISACKTIQLQTSDSVRREKLASESSDAAAVLSVVPSEINASKARAAVNGEANGAFSSQTAPAARPKAHRQWQSVKHVNGVAVYAEEEEDGEGGAVMASVVVRAPPRACFQALMHTTPVGGGELPFSDSVTLLETIDAHTQIVRHFWKPEGGMSTCLTAPREIIALRTWRKEEDGTYIVLYQSTNHKKARSERKGWALWSSAPVRAKVQAAGFTISPLLPQYCPSNGASQECLVTLVVKADLAGSLSPASYFSRAVPLVADAARWSILSPLLMSVVALRDRVEQRRFVVMPYTLSPSDVEAPVPGESYITDETSEDGGSQPSSPLFQRTTTGLTETALSGGYFSSSKRTPLPPVVEESFADALSEGEVGSEGSTATAPAPAAAAGAEPSTPTSAPPPAAADVSEDGAWAVSGTTEKQFWSYPGSSNLRIRGSNYLNDKVKIPASPPMFDLYASDLVDGDEPFWNISEHLPSMQNCSAPFAFVLNLIYPNGTGMLQSLVTIWTAPVDVEAMDEEHLVQKWGDDPQGTVRAFFRNFKPWIEGDGPEADARRNIKFKLIPRVAQGSWVVRQSVGVTPVLLGQKLKTKYFRGVSAAGCKYFECDVDITSNTVANSVTKLVVNSITSLVVDLAPLVEGQAPDELPERLIGSVRYDHLDLRTAAVWDETKNDGKGAVVKRM